MILHIVHNRIVESMLDIDVIEKCSRWFVFLVALIVISVVIVHFSVVIVQLEIISE